MPRPPCCRRIAAQPSCGLFKPAGAPCRSLEEVVLTLDELEAVRLADLEGLYQEQASARMNVSRQTFARIVESARKKIAQALVQAKALRIEGGVIQMANMRKFLCAECNKEWEIAYGLPRPRECPACGGVNIHRHPDDRGGWRWRGGRGAGAGAGGGVGRRGGRGRCFRGGWQQAGRGAGRGVSAGRAVETAQDSAAAPAAEQSQEKE